jgi:hypothetical protein
VGCDGAAVEQPGGGEDEGAGSAEERAKPGARAWFPGAVIGILLLFAGNGGVTVGETTLPSG